jgi:hypothetical protein
VFRNEHTLIGALNRLNIQTRLTSRPAASANNKTETARVLATFQFVARPIVSSEGRLIAGPAISIATAAAGGAPEESRINAKGISKKVGNANGTATTATATTTKIFAAVESNGPTGNQRATSIEIKTPTAINGTVRTATCHHERNSAANVG